MLKVLMSLATFVLVKFVLFIFFTVCPPGTNCLAATTSYTPWNFDLSTRTSLSLSVTWVRRHHFCLGKLSSVVVVVVLFLQVWNKYHFNYQNYFVHIVWRILTVFSPRKSHGSWKRMHRIFWNKVVIAWCNSEVWKQRTYFHPFSADFAFCAVMFCPFENKFIFIRY